MAFYATGLKIVIKCKTLKFADKKYLKEGIKRFIELKYAKKDGFAGMLGFIIAGNSEKIIENLKKKVKNFYPTPNMNKWLEKKLC